MSMVFTILTMLGLGLTPSPNPDIKISLTKCVRIVKTLIFDGPMFLPEKQS